MKTKEKTSKDLEKSITKFANEIYELGFADGLNVKKIISKEYRKCPNFIRNFYNKDQPNMENHL